jgi:hypothetical protein
VETLEDAGDETFIVSLESSSEGKLDGAELAEMVKSAGAGEHCRSFCAMGSAFAEGRARSS